MQASSFPPRRAPGRTHGPGAARPGLPMLLAAWLIAGSARAAAPQFEAVEIDPAACQVAVYAVALADVDGDRRDDIIAVTENRVLWWRNPDWSPRVILEQQTEPDNVCIAPYDIDGDGALDFALGAGWLNGKHLGTIQWLSRGAALDDRWTVHPVGAISWTHRMRFGDVLGRGRPQLVVSPLNATTSPGVELTAFEIPPNPKVNPWPKTVLHDGFHRMHNHWQLPAAAGGHGTLTASQEGVHWLTLAGGEVQSVLIGRGAEGDAPEAQGAGEVKAGRTKAGPLLLATIEPMHGHMGVVYRLPPGNAPGPALERLVLVDSLKQGHAVGLADFDSDGDDDALFGFREPGPGPVVGPGLLLFENVDGEGRQWTQHVLDDGGVAVEDAALGDVDGDGRVDIVAGGRATKNVRLYRNRGPAAP